MRRPDQVLLCGLSTIGSWAMSGAHPVVAYGTGLFEGQDGRLAPATVTLSAPAGVYAPEPAYFTQMAVSISGMAGHSELSWAETAASCWRPVTP